MQYILNLINEGEHQKLDFKYAVNDMRKIAKTLSAFANSYGGRLLIGVKDNGRVKGCRPEEEKHMLEFASEKYCMPKVDLKFETHRVEDKNILEVFVEEGRKKPYLAEDLNSKKIAYARMFDEVIPMHPVMYKALRSTGKHKSFEYTDIEKNILNFIAQNKKVDFFEINRVSGISKFKTEWILADLINFDVVKIRFEEGNWFFSSN